MPQSLEDIKENVRASSDIVDVIGGYISLKRAGAASYKALCPFHKEKTPSFTVNQQRQSFHCFGCGAGGDVFKFVMDHEGVDFMTSLRMLGERAGIAVDSFRRGGASTSDKKALYDIHGALTEFYQHILLKDRLGAPAREYLQGRDLGAEAIEKFGIGYAAPRNTVLDWARKRDFSRQQLVKAGVLVQKNGECYDRFRGRIMFPIRDTLGRVIGFSGRILDTDKSPAKYLNSPETLLFKKSRVLYGFDRARKSITDARQAIVCEGQLDCIRCHLAGFDNAVAPQGTAMTEEQARSIARQADSAVLLFDPDEAGVKAAARAAEIMLSESLSVSIAMLPEGSDPDSLIREQGPEALRSIIDAARSPVEFLHETLSAQENMDSETGVLRVSRALLDLIAKSGSAVQRDGLLRQSAALLGMPESAMRRDLASVGRNAPVRAATPPGRSASRRYPAEQRALLSCLLENPSLRDDAREYLAPDMFSSPPCRAIFIHILRSSDCHDKGLTQTLDTDNKDVIELASSLDNSPEPESDPDFSVEDHFLTIALRLIRRHFQSERERLRKLPHPGAAEERLKSDLTNWMAKLNELRGCRDWDSARRFLQTVSLVD